MIYQIPVGAGFEMRRKMFPALVFLPVLWYAGIRQKTTGVDTMAEQEMLLDTATIKAAVAGEKWAKQKVIEHYTPMIDELAVERGYEAAPYFEATGRTAKLPDGTGIKKSAGRRGFDTSAPGVLDNCRLCHSMI